MKMILFAPKPVREVLKWRREVSKMYNAMTPEERALYDKNSESRFRQQMEDLGFKNAAKIQFAGSPARQPSGEEK
jgi:hypothetical protein